MNIEDCKVGENVIFGNKKWTIRKIYDNRLDLINKNRNERANVNHKYVEPANKFEVGDEVNYKINCAKGNGFEGEIFGVENKNNKPIYAVKCEFKDGDEFVVFANESELSPLKKTDELKVGDKFYANCGRKYKVLFVEKDNFHNKIAYFSKTINGTYKGVLRIFNPNDVEEIIYD